MCEGRRRIRDIWIYTSTKGLHDWITEFKSLPSTCMWESMKQHKIQDSLHWLRVLFRIISEIRYGFAIHYGFVDVAFEAHWVRQYVHTWDLWLSDVCMYNLFLKCPSRNICERPYKFRSPQTLVVRTAKQIRSSTHAQIRMGLDIFRTLLTQAR